MTEQTIWTAQERIMLKRTLLRLKPAIKSFWLAESGSPSEDRAVDIVVSGIEEIAVELAGEGEDRDG